MSTSRTAVIFAPGSSWSWSLISPLYAWRLWRMDTKKMSKHIIIIFRMAKRCLMLNMFIKWCPHHLMCGFVCCATDYREFRWASLLAFSMLVNGSCKPSVFSPCVYLQPSREQLIEHYLNSTQLEAASDTTFMGWDKITALWFLCPVKNWAKPLKEEKWTLQVLTLVELGVFNPHS